MTDPTGQRRDAPDPRRIWLAVVVGTVFQVIGYGSFLLGVIATQSETPEAAGPAFALGFTMVPIVLAAVAFISGQPRAPMATLKGMGMWLLVTLPIGLLNPVTGLCAGYGAAGALTLRAAGVRSLRARLVAVAAATVYSTLLVVTILPAGILTGAVAPLLAVKVGDLFHDRRSPPDRS
jgi:hypothetical protein